MKILQAEIRNFGAIGEADMALDDKGLILIQGFNEDDSSQESNGSGKSTLPDAICWAFYGETAKGESGDKIVNRKAKKNCSVSVTTVDEDTDDVYRITRYRKHSAYKNMLRLELQQGANWKDLTKGTDKLTQDLVVRVIGCNYEVFSSAIYAGQEAMPDLPGMTDKQLKVLIEESAGIAQLQSASDIARRIVAERKSVVQDAGSKIASKMASIETLNGTLESEVEKSGEFEKCRVVDVAAAEAAHAAKAAAFDNKLGTRIGNKVDQLKAEAEEIRNKIAGSDEERQAERKLSKEANEKVNALHTCENALNNSVAQAQAAKHALEHVADKVGSPCGECGHVVEASDLAGSEEAAKKKLVDLLSAAKKRKQELADAREASELASKQLSDHSSAMTDVSAMALSLSATEDSLSKLRAAHKTWTDARVEVEKLAAVAEIIKTKVNPHLRSIADCEARIKLIEEEVEKMEADRKVLADSLFVAEQAMRVFSPAGVRAHILDTVTPHLNARTSHYLSILTDGNVTAVWSTVSATAKGELREKFVIDVASDTGGESFKSLSGGEKRKVRLACAMALQDLVASRATKPIKLFIADEIDHALDPAGLERLMTILEEKSRDKGTVLVISHTDLRDSIRNSITVTKKGGFATLKADCLA